LIGTAFVHTVIDDHSHVAYVEIHEDEKAATAIRALRRGVSWFAARGAHVERVLSDNGSAYKSHAWRDACTELGITPKRPRAYRPQTNGKIQRFDRTLADGWAFSRHYPTETAGWIDTIDSPTPPPRSRPSSNSSAGGLRLSLGWWARPTAP
jgi:transposase InsO family protein